MGSSGGPVGVRRGQGCLSSLWVKVVGVPLSWEGAGTFGVPVGVGALGVRVLQ